MRKQKRFYLGIAILAFLLLFSTACSSSTPPANTGGSNNSSNNEQATAPETGGSAADDFPNKPIEVVVAYAAGGGTDVGARILTTAAEKVSGHSFVVVNKPGAGGEMGYTYLTKAKPDGYTIGFINLPTFVSLPEERPTEYKMDDVEAIMLHVYDPAFIVVQKGSDIDTLDKFLAYAKANPQKITISNNGTGASNHIAAAHFELEAGIEVTHVPFDGTNELVTALRGGHVMAGVAKLSEIASHVASGELVAVASMTDERLEGFEEVPTLKENGINVVAASGRGVVAPKGTPQEIIDTLHEILKEAALSEEHIEQAKNISLPLRYMGPEEFWQFIVDQDKENKELSQKLDLGN